MLKIVGDVMLDKWIYGDATRISPEAPVPVLKQNGFETSAGGAANLALNLKNLCDDIALYGAVGFDKEGAELLSILSKTGIDCFINKDASVTTTKTRLVGQGGQHICRWDVEDIYNNNLENFFFQDIKQDDVVILSDYNKGVINSNLVKNVLSKTNKVYVDPKQNPETYKGVFLVKPNMKEYEQWFGKFNSKTASLHCYEYNWQWLIVTDGANGVHVTNINGDYYHYKETAKEVADVTGAGDTFLAVLVYAHEHKNINIPNACELACYGSTRIVEKRGVALIDHDMLNRGIVWTNGVFDILHPGHLELLKYAKNLGTKLVVGINDDESVKRLKGPDRPINNFTTRKQQLETLPWVDEVVVFAEDTPLETIKQIRPDIIVKGGDYTVETTVGHEFAEVKIFPTVEGHSTTNILNKLKK